MEIYQRKQKALKLFIKRLNNIEVAHLIRHIVLFGSMAWGRPNQNSDVDLAIFADDPDQIAPIVDNLTFKVMLETGEMIEPIIYRTNVYDHPSSYLTWLIREKGQPLPMAKI